MDGNTFSLSSLPCGEQQSVQASYFTRFFIIKRTDSASNNSFKNTSPFLISKTFQSILGELPSIKKLQSGDLLVEVSSANQSNTLSKCSVLGSFSVSVNKHPTLNTCRGVISESDLLYSTKEEILEHLQSQNVIDARRITIRRNEQILPTKHIILTFNSPTLPNRIKAAYLSCSVRPYIPNPLRCFKCQRYGHAKTSCRGSVTCARCAEVGHDNSECDKPEHCVNCKGDHPAFSRTCPKWILEKEIQTVKITNNIAYREARRQVESRTPSIGISYTTIVKSHPNSHRNASTQTLPVTSSISSSKTTRSVGSTCETTNFTRLTLWPPSSEPVLIEYLQPKPKKKSVTSASSSERNHSISTVNNQKSNSPANEPSSSKTNERYPKKSRVPNLASQPIKKTELQKPKISVPSSSANKTPKIKNRTSPLRPPFAKFKGSKRLQHFVEEAMESEANEHDSEYSDVEDNMSEIT